MRWSFALYYLHNSFCINRMKPRKVKEDDAPRTIACPHKVSLTYSLFKIMSHLKKDGGVFHCIDLM